MASLEARILAAALLLVSLAGCGSDTPQGAAPAGAGGEAAAAPIDETDVVASPMPRPGGSGSAEAEGVGVFQALSSRAIREVHVVPGTHLAFVENYDDTHTLIDVETGAVRAVRRLAFEGEVESRLVVDETGAFAAIGVLPLYEAGSATGPVYVWDLAADRTRVARLAGDASFAATDIAILPGGGEIAVFEAPSPAGAHRPDAPPQSRVLRVDPFTRAEQEVRIDDPEASTVLAYAGPRSRALVARQGSDRGGATRVLGAEGTVSPIEGVRGLAVVRPTGGQMLVQADDAWEVRRPSDGSLLARLAIPRDARVAYSSTGACIVAHVEGNEFLFVDPSTGQAVAELGAEGVLGMDAVGRCERAVTLGRDRSLLLVDLAEGAGTPRRFDAASFAWTADDITDDETIGLTTTDDGRFAVSWDEDSIVSYDLTRGTSSGLRTLGYSPSVWSVVWSARGDALLAQTRESSFVIDGTDAATSNVDCGLGYVVQTPANGAFVVEEGRTPTCALRATLTIAESDEVVRYADSGDAAIVRGPDDVALVRSGAPRKRLASRTELGCAGDDCTIHGVFSADGARVALLGARVVFIADVARGRVLARHTLTNVSPYALAFTAGVNEVLAIADGVVTRLPVRGRAQSTIPLASPSRVPESGATPAYVAVDGARLRVLELGGQGRELYGLELEEDSFESVELVSQNDPFLFRVKAGEREFVLDVAQPGSRAVSGTLLGARRDGQRLVIAACRDGEIRVENGANDDRGVSLGECVGVRQVVFSPDGVHVAIVRGASIELRRADGTGAVAYVTLLETEDAGFVLANAEGRYHAPAAARPFVRYRTPGDARTAPLAAPSSSEGYDPHLLGRFFGRAPVASTP